MNGLMKVGTALSVIGVVSCVVGIGFVGRDEGDPMYQVGGLLLFYGFYFGLLIGLLIFAVGRMVGDGPAVKAKAKAEAKQAELQAMSERIKSLNR